MEQNQKKLILDTSIYPLEAIYGAAYVFIDRAYIYLDEKKSGQIIIYLKKKPSVNCSLDEIEGEFLNELLNYLIRVKLSKENKKIREFIVGQALISAVAEKKIMNEKKFEYEDDPLGIAIPWEEKYGKK